MNNEKIKKYGIILSSFFVGIYLLFLVLPFIISPIINNYSGTFSQTIEKESGFKCKLEKIQLVTTPKLTIGAKVGELKVFLPNNDKVLQSDNFQIKLSLLPILLGKIELDLVGADSIELDLKVQRDGKFFIENFIPKQKQEAPKKKPSKAFLKLSNHLPDVKIGNYKINFVDMQTNKSYYLEGEDTKVSDFVLDKKVKISGVGKMVLDGEEQFKYDVQLFNKIMPNVQLNDLVFNPQIQEEQPQAIKFNIIKIFNAIYNNEITANLKCDVKTYGSFDDVRVDGAISLDEFSIDINDKELPDSFIKLNLKGNKIGLDSDLYTSENEITHIKGDFKTGKKAALDMSFKSNANLKNVFEIIKSVAKSFGVNDLQTLSANGAIDADFNIKSNLKKIESSGYFKIPDGNIKYGLYNIAINKINSDIRFDNNAINIVNTGFYVLGHPLKIYGSIQQDASASINLVADRLSIKSILLSLGQMSLLRENRFNSGDLTLKAKLQGRLDKPQALANLSIANINLKNVPTGSVVILPNVRVDLNLNNKSYKGNASINGLKIINPAAVVSAPSVTALIEPKAIIIKPANVLIDRIKLVISGEIEDYLTNKMILDIKTGGNINSTLKGTVNAASQKIRLDYSIPYPCTFPIPGFLNSKIQVKGNLVIAGSMANPSLKGTFVVPYILLPDMLVSMSDMVINLNGPILKGNGTVKKITSGGVVAQNLGANFILKGNLFYLNNILGDAYSGKVKGSVVYNIINGKTSVDFKGYNMNAATAIAGVAGIKDALSGTLGFNTKIAFQGVEYADIIKSLKGDFSFIVEDGALGKIGRLENFLNAQNILANAVMKHAINSITSVSTVKNTALFKYIKGNMSFSNGWANIYSIKTSGPTMSYYVKGRYNILNGTANVVVLGRLSSDVVALLGPIGDLSVDKLTSYIPKFGNLTAIIIKSMTTNPAEENIAEIPPLSSGEKYHKDFKVVFNGGVESKSSVKSFKWLSDVDTSVFDMKFNVKNAKKQFTDARDSAIGGVKKQYSDVKNSAVTGVKSTVNETKKQLQDAAGEWKDLLKF